MAPLTWCSSALVCVGGVNLRKEDGTRPLVEAGMCSSLLFF